MRLFVFSDWRGQPTESLFDTLDSLEKPVDMILYAGDDLHRFKKADGGNVLSELANQTRLGKVFAVAGNDDVSPSQDLLPGSEVRVPESNQVMSGDGVFNLHQNPVVEDEYVFLGLEGAVEGGPGITLYSEKEIESHLGRQYSGFQDKIPVLVSHVPPNGILDIGQRFGQRHIGSKSVRRFIERVNPVLTVCGHCHLFGGRAEEGSFGTVINIASHDDKGAKGRYGIAELDGDAVEYELMTTDAGVDSELFQLSQVGGRRVRQFGEAGFTELADIVEGKRDMLLELPGVYDWHVDMWLKEVDAVRSGEIVVRDSGSFEFLEDDPLVLLDIETDLNQERTWLVGLYSYRDEEFTRVFEKDDEESLLERVVEYLEDHEERTIVYYGNNRFDEKCLRQRLEAHGMEGKTKLFEDAHDLGIQVHNHLLGNFNRTNLDAMSKRLADYEYEHPDIDGLYVGSQFTRYLLEGEEADWQKLIEYNRDDVFAMKAVADEVQELLSDT